jgi:hypothetical protein
MQATGPLLQEKVIDRVLSQPAGPRRWRAAVDAWLALNPMGNDGLSARTENALIIRDNKRDLDLNRNVYGTSGDPNSGLRRAMSFPAGAVYVIELADPLAFKEKANVMKLRKTFPEYCVTEKS